MRGRPPRLLFIHGWATDGAVWDEQARRFGAAFDAIRIDLPGHGGPGRWDEPTLEAAVKEVERRIIGLDDRTVVGIGWSLGAQVLIEASARRRVGFHSLVLVGATPCFVKRDGFPWGQPKALVKRMVLDMKKEPASTLKRFYALNFTEKESSTAGARAFIERYVPDGRKTGGPEFRYRDITTALEALYNIDIRGSLVGIDVPALVMHGQEDGVCPPGAGEYLASNLKNSVLKVFDGAGHAPFITRPDDFYEAVKDFLSRI